MIPRISSTIFSHHKIPEKLLGTCRLCWRLHCSASRAVSSAATNPCEHIQPMGCENACGWLGAVDEKEHALF